MQCVEIFRCFLNILSLRQALRLKAQYNTYIFRWDGVRVLYTLGPNAKNSTPPDSGR